MNTSIERLAQFLTRPEMIGHILITGGQPHKTAIEEAIKDRPRLAKDILFVDVDNLAPHDIISTPLKIFDFLKRHSDATIVLSGEALTKLDCQKLLKGALDGTIQYKSMLIDEVAPFIGTLVIVVKDECDLIPALINRCFKYYL